MNIVRDNMPVEGCTISSALTKTITVFSLAPSTSISPESLPGPSLVQVLWGTLTLSPTNITLKPGEIFLVEGGRLCGFQSEHGAVYLIHYLAKETSMNTLEAGNALDLATLVPVIPGKIVNRDVIATPHMKFAVLGLGEGTALSPHAAPGDAILFALEGQAEIFYEGKTFALKAGEQTKFAKGGLHGVTAKGPFKMALCVSLE